ncbi:MAG: hypothetical protein GF375_01120 [Candidatus Omnitrophica bacterium]|nr:hypothetical protein [Candidatus Omnitrophota bacterium]
MVIANPTSDTVMDMANAVALLKNPYKDAKKFRHSDKSSYPMTYELPGKIKHFTPEQKKIYVAVLEGRKEEIEEEIKKALRSGISPYNLIDEVIIPAINEVGKRFENKEYFLPQLISSAETAKRAFEELKPHIKKKRRDKKSRIVVILATVKGDIHDIGKNIVSLILQNHGFGVIDLGKDVSAQRIINEARKHKNPVIGLSALMTTTMVNMKEVVKKASQQGVNCTFLVGGAVVNKSFASSLGARYANDGIEAVKIIKKIYSKEKGK